MQEDIVRDKNKLYPDLTNAQMRDITEFEEGYIFKP